MAPPSDGNPQEGPDTREAVQLFIAAVRRHSVRVVFTTLVFVLIGLGITMLWPPKYKSETQFMLRESRLVTDSAAMQDLEKIPLSKKLQSLQNELKSMRRVGDVLDELQWKEWLETAGRPSRRRALYVKIKGNLGVAMSPDVTGSINATISFAWTSPGKAADFVNRLRDAWIKLVSDGYRKTLENDKERAEKLLAERQQDYNDRLGDVHTYEQENDVPSLLTNEINNEMKAETQLKLSEARARLESTVTDIEILRTELNLIAPQYEDEVLPNNPEQALAWKNLEKAKAAFRNIEGKYMPAHRKYEAAVDAIAAADAELAAAGGTPEKLKSIENNPLFQAKAAQLVAATEEEREYRALVETYQTEVEAIEERLRRLPVVTSQLRRLNSQVATADELLNQARLDIQPLRDRVAAVRSQNTAVNQSGGILGRGAFEIIDQGIEPERPMLPIGAIIMALSLILGVGTGLLGPVLSELTRSSFGSVKEVTRTLGVPVLGAVDLILTARDVRARSVQSALTITTMALVLTALATALYIYSAKPHVLPASVLRTLREVQLALT